MSSEVVEALSSGNMGGCGERAGRVSLRTDIEEGDLEGGKEEREGWRCTPGAEAPAGAEAGAAAAKDAVSALQRSSVARCARLVDELTRHDKKVAKEKDVSAKERSAEEARRQLVGLVVRKALEVVSDDTTLATASTNATTNAGTSAGGAFDPLVGNLTSASYLLFAL